MSATYKGSMVALAPIEGGYCVGIECGSSNSGETYRGIDRKYQPQWAGWKIIDAYKKKYGRPKYGSFIKDPSLDAAVAQFYTTFWNNKGMANFRNQTLAGLLWALVVHRENKGIAHINAVAKKMGAKQFSSNSITANVAQSIERGLPGSYEVVWNSLKAYYKQFKNGNTFIKNRVEVFPASLVNKPAPNTGLITKSPGIDAAGMAMLVYKMFF